MSKKKPRADRCCDNPLLVDESSNTEGILKILRNAVYTGKPICCVWLVPSEKEGALTSGGIKSVSPNTKVVEVEQIDEPEVITEPIVEIPQGAVQEDEVL